ncbi:TonB-dependent Receptor Plug Domain [Parapedobacter composti]|uniref:TonB-dependent Receptor Plug Domain n=1 Tax=Parapedobacter composti TaxID=623281 RepID=A0A1I1GL74_9SPHI|nr:TonB-dependent receptor [Parapedobacter composti]SFC10618.1 TonB-dependent Receptor Plug Domain [Parapedobacter composti]
MKKFLLIMVVFWVTVGATHAQVTTSSMTGSVLQANGQAFAGATVKATHVPSGTVYSTTTNESGRFNLANLRVGGPYRVEVTYVGQSPEVYEDIHLQLGQPYVLNALMSDGTTALDEVTVSADRQQGVKTGVSTIVSRQKIEEMPAISRSITDLTKLTPQANSQGDGFSFVGRNSLFNSLTLDGAQMNNAFGLSALPGGQTGAQPFSLDAIETIQINLSPYDVKQGGFTGAGVNAVTKSGNNTLSGSVYTYYKNQDLQGYTVDGVKLPKNESYTNRQFGVRIGGPIIKDKLFFFVNGEITRRTTPGTTILANRGTEGPNISRVLASDLDRVRDVLINNFGYNPGVYEGYDNLQQADNLTARFDWNIDAQHKMTLRYNYLSSFRDINPSTSNSRGGRGPSLTSMIYDGLRYRQYNNINSITAELNSSFNSRTANNLQIVYTAFRDYREPISGAFPLVDIEDGAGANYISFGSEPFSGLNELNQDIFTLTNNFNLFSGNHTFTFGGSLGYQKYANAFAQFFNGQFRYNTVDDFIAAANGDGSVTPLLYQLTYSAVEGVSRPFAEFSMMPIALYAQDEWFVKPNFKLSYGIRADIPVYTAKISSNPIVNAMTFRDGERLDVGQLPKTRVLMSPRVGFDWDVYQDRSLIVRGGSGVFTGGLPGVWLTNQAGNTGLTFGQDFLNNPANRPFDPDPSAYIPSNPTVPSTFAINMTANDFRLPQIWRSNLAVEYLLPAGIRASLEGIYTKSINEVFHRDANLRTPAGQYSGTGDNRDYFQGGGTASRINENITNAIVMDNTNQGYAYNITAQLQKQFGRYGDAMLAYTYSDARDITSNPGSQANSAYVGNAIVNDPNNPVLAYSSFLVRNRVVAGININFNITRNLPSKIGLFYEGRPAGDNFGNTRFNYVVAGDILNTGGRFSNSLIYVPRDRNDIVLVDITGDNPESADAQWQRLDAYIEQDDYLKTRRGNYAERNGGEYPWMNRFDIRYIQELTGVISGKNTHRLQVSLDIINVGNLLNSSWGVVQMPNMTNFLQFRGVQSSTPTYTVNQNLEASTFRNNTSIDSRYQIQLGLRYIFN